MKEAVQDGGTACIKRSVRGARQPVRFAGEARESSAVEDRQRLASAVSDDAWQRLEDELVAQHSDGSLQVKAEVRAGQLAGANEKGRVV
jgi:hypothetical protein